MMAILVCTKQDWDSGEKINLDRDSEKGFGDLLNIHIREETVSVISCIQI